MLTKPYGTWGSPITANKVSSSIVAFQDVVIDGDDIYWSEMRPAEKGRYVIIKYSPQEELLEVLPPEYSARTRVHEYGGAAFTVDKGIIYFTNDADQRLYQILPGQLPKPLVQAGIRFAEYKVTPYGIIAIAESHLKAPYIENFLALIDPNTGDIKKLASGSDFYAFPALNKNFTQIAWVAWDHPNMPWDNTTLWVADITRNGLTNQRRVDENAPHQSFLQPQWGPNNELVVVSDKSNWWNLYQVKDYSLRLLFAVESEIGMPLWNLGASCWGFFHSGILSRFSPGQSGESRLCLFKNGEIEDLDLPYSQFSQIRIANDTIACIASAPDKPTAIICLKGKNRLKVLKENIQLDLKPGYFSQPEHVTFASKNGRLAHGYFYPPHNKDYQGPNNTLPPLIVKSHGGPTANCGCALNLEIQYWTSRGYAVMDVNYGGSTGYGRTYRESLKGHWGVVDVEDCEAAALYLAQKGRVNGNKLAIMGNSAGGYTTLAALTFTDTFHVGASLYGVSDCSALAQDTHKFESRYLDGLIGAYPEEKAKYEARSPIYHIDRLNAPVIFFQGEQDKVVPPDQAEKMYQALLAKGIATRLFLFDDEQHGFRNAANKEIVLKEQERFFRKVLKLDN